MNQHDHKYSIIQHAVTHADKLWQILNRKKICLELKKKRIRFNNITRILISIIIITLSHKIKTKIVFFVIIMFADKKTEFWLIIISSKRWLNITWFLLLKISWVLLRILIKVLSIFILILWSEIVTIMLIKILVMLLNFIFLFFKF